MYINIDKTQITPTCISNMILNGDFEILKYFVEKRNETVVFWLHRIAMEVDMVFATKVVEEKWKVHKFL